MINSNINQFSDSANWVLHVSFHQQVVSITERMRNECDNELEGTVIENKQLEEEFVTLSEAHHKLLVQISDLREQYMQWTKSKICVYLEHHTM